MHLVHPSRLVQTSRPQLDCDPLDAEDHDSKRYQEPQKEHSIVQFVLVGETFTLFVVSSFELVRVDQEV